MSCEKERKQKWYKVETKIRKENGHIVDPGHAREGVGEPWGGGRGEIAEHLGEAPSVS